MREAYIEFECQSWTSHHTTALSRSRRTTARSDDCNVICLASHTACLNHDAGPGHPERPDRIGAALEGVRSALPDEVVLQLETREADPAEIALVHRPGYIEAMRRLCQSGGEYIPAMEANVGTATWDAALNAVGAGLSLADWMLRQDSTLASQFQNPRSILQNTKGFALVRPPGHHALADRPMGFCLFNNIAVLARYLQVEHRISRIAIIDFDVHHGNGTEAVFWKDETVLFISIHRDNLFPYHKGMREDRGAGKGLGRTLNLPLPAGSDDDVYQVAYEREIIPAIDDFVPEFILVSAGFDAHWRDPLGGMRVTGAGYQMMGERIRDLAERHSNGRVIALLEGGYDLTGLKDGVSGFVSGLQG
ncbi:MAG: histone deacetylase [Calditrichaeota bacterium]|nr:histone deacetylase [Calditrichota bacterium]